LTMATGEGSDSGDIRQLLTSSVEYRYLKKIHVNAGAGRGAYLSYRITQQR
jgi:hypothetical protein